MLLSHDYDTNYEWREPGAARTYDLVIGIKEDWGGKGIWDEPWRVNEIDKVIKGRLEEHSRQKERWQREWNGKDSGLCNMKEARYLEGREGGGEW